MSIHHIEALSNDTSRELIYKHIKEDLYERPMFYVGANLFPTALTVSAKVPVATSVITNATINTTSKVGATTGYVHNKTHLLP